MFLYIYVCVYISGGGERLHTWLAYEEVTEYSHKMVPSAICYIGQLEPRGDVQASLREPAVLTHVSSLITD